MTAIQTALVTGASSWLGSELVRALGADGVDVHAVVRPSSDTGALARLPTPPTLHSIDDDAGLQGALKAAKPDVVFHLAGLYSRDDDAVDVQSLIDANIGFGARLLDAMRKSGVRNLVNTTTYFEFMDGADRPRPVNSYAAMKRAFAELLDYFADAYDLSYTTLVLFDTYGPGDVRGKLMEMIARNLLAGTPLPLPQDEIRVNTVYISDVVAAFIRAGELLASDRSQVAGRRFAVKSEMETTIREIVGIFEEVGGRRINLRVGAWPKPDRSVGAFWDGACVPGWRPQVDLEQGCGLLLESLRNG